MSTAYSAILSEFLERYELGELGVTTATGDSSSIIDATRFGSGLRAGNEYPQRSPILVLSGARAGEHTFKSDFDVDTGDFTVAPVLTGAPASGVSFAIVPPNVAPHFDRFLEALNRYLTTRMQARRWMRVGCTMAKGGDLMGTVAADWTILAGSTGVYTDLDIGLAHFEKVLQLTVDDPADYATLTTPTPCRPGSTWQFWGFHRPAAASSTSRIRIFDITNTAEITPTFEIGAATNTIFGAFKEVRGTFDVPSTCGRINVRFIVDEDNGVGQFGPWLWAPVGAMEYGVGSRFDGMPGEIHDWHSWRSDSNGAMDLGHHTPAHPVYRGTEQYGWGMGMKFGNEPPFPLFYDDLLPYPSLSSVSDETDCPKELAIRGMAWEFFKWAGRRVRRAQGDPEGTRWAEDVAAALEELEDAETPAQYGAERRFAVRQAYSPQVSMR